jgi:hypothetical protein
MSAKAYVGIGVITLIMMLVLAGAANSEDGGGVADTVDSPMVLAHYGKPISLVSQQRQGGSCWYITESGYIAAVEEDLLDRAIFWAGVGDAQEFEKFITSNPLVFPLRAGLRVQIDKFSFSDKVRIRPHGTSISVWTVREAIRSAVPMDGS